MIKSIPSTSFHSLLSLPSILESFIPLSLSFSKTCSDKACICLEEVPEVIVADDLQEKFGGIKSFDWAIEDNSGTSSTAPGFQIIGTSEEK